MIARADSLKEQQCAGLTLRPSSSLHQRNPVALGSRI